MLSRKYINIFKMLYFIIVYILIVLLQQGILRFTYYPCTHVHPEKKIYRLNFNILSLIKKYITTIVNVSLINYKWTPMEFSYARLI